MASAPSVSIVVPSYQKGRFLRAALESLLRQTCASVEILVADNLSTDETPGILDRYAPRLAGRGSVVRERDAGQSDALRRAFARAEGEVLGWLNADDLLMPQALERAAAALQAGAGLVYGHCALVDEDGQFLSYYHDIQTATPEQLRNQGVFFCQPAAFFRRELYERAGGLDPDLRYAMDWDLWCRMARAGGRFESVNEVWAASRIYAQTKTRAGGRRRLAEIFRVNRLHKTTWIPRAALGMTYGALVRRCWPGLDRPMGALWRFWTGQTVGRTVVEGLAPGRRLAAPRARIRFPLFRESAGARLRIIRPGPSDTPPVVRVALNGQPAELEDRPGAQVGAWRFAERRFVETVELEFELDARAELTFRRAPQVAEFVMEFEASRGGVALPPGFG